MHRNPLIFRLKSTFDMAASPLYYFAGRRPWSPGYYSRKKSQIEAAIDERSIRTGRPLPEAFGAAIDERIVEYPWLFDRLAQFDTSLGRILDAGSTLNHDYILERRPLKGADLTIMTLAPENRCYWYKGYSYVFGDFRQTNFKDGSFDTLISISTLEHVGLDNTLLYTSDKTKAESNRNGFIDAVVEFRRILAPGGRCLITIPCGKRADFGWFQLFDQKMIQSLIKAFSPSLCEVEYFRYDKSGWQRAVASEVANATAFDPHSGRGRLDDRAGCARAIACVQMTK